MTRGDTVTIYEDPITRRKPEGEARLVRRLDDGSRPMQRWLVQFPAEIYAPAMRVERNIYTG